MFYLNQNPKSYFRSGTVSFSDDVGFTAWVGKRVTTTPLKPLVCYEREMERRSAKTLPSVLEIRHSTGEKSFATSGSRGR